MTHRALKGCTCRFCGPLPGGKKKMIDDRDHDARDFDAFAVDPAPEGKCMECGAAFGRYEDGHIVFRFDSSDICDQCHQWKKNAGSRLYDEILKDRRGR